MKKTTLIAVAVVTLLASMALAQPGPFGRRDCSMGDGMQMGKQFARMDRCGMRQHKGMQGIQMILNLEDELALSSEQKTKLEKMRTDFAMEKIDRQAALKKAQVKLRDLMRDEIASETNVNMAIDEVSRLKADIQKMRYNHRKQVQTALNEDQLNKLKEMKKKHQQEMYGQRHLKQQQQKQMKMFRKQIDDDDI